MTMTKESPEDAAAGCPYGSWDGWTEGQTYGEGQDQGHPWWSHAQRAENTKTEGQKLEGKTDDKS